MNGISPEEKTVKNGTFPFLLKVHVAIRSDLDHNSMAYRLYEWLLSEDAKSTITECGFLPKDHATTKSLDGVPITYFCK